MPLHEDQRVKIEQQRKDDTVKNLERVIDEGKSAERLLANPDWQKLCARVNDALVPKKNNMNVTIESIAVQAISRDQRDQAWEDVRKYSQEIRDFEYFMAMPNRSVEAANQAREQLKKLKGGS